MDENQYQNQNPQYSNQNGNPIPANEVTTYVNNDVNNYNAPNNNLANATPGGIYPSNSTQTNNMNHANYTQNTNYSQNVNYNNNNANNYYSTSLVNDPISMKEWLIILLLLCVPILNIVLLIMWAIGGDNVKESKRNFSRAYLIYTGIILVLTLIITLVVSILGASLGAFSSTRSKSSTTEIIADLPDDVFTTEASATEDETTEDIISENPPADDMTTDDSAAEKKTVDTTSSTATGSWKDGSFTVNGTTLTIPFSYAELEAAGFKLERENLLEEVLNANEYSTSCTVKDNAGNAFSINFINPSDTTKSAKDCDICGFSFFSYQTKPSFSLANGITFDMTTEEVMQAMGNQKPDYEYKSDDGSYVSYEWYNVEGKSYSGGLTITFSDGAISDISYKDLVLKK